LHGKFLWDGGDGHHVFSDIFPFQTVAAGGSRGQNSVFIHKIYSQAVYFNFAADLKAVFMKN
jgi:hypothetical protein